MSRTYAVPFVLVKVASYRVRLTSHRQMLHWLLTVLPSRKEAPRVR